MNRVLDLTVSVPAGHQYVNMVDTEVPLPLEEDKWSKCDHFLQQALGDRPPQSCTVTRPGLCYDLIVATNTYSESISTQLLWVS